jgi:hypothetical protein
MRHFKIISCTLIFGNILVQIMGGGGVAPIWFLLPARCPNAVTIECIHAKASIRVIQNLQRNSCCSPYYFDYFHYIHWTMKIFLLLTDPKGNQNMVKLHKYECDHPIEILWFNIFELRQLSKIKINLKHSHGKMYRRKLKSRLKNDTYIKIVRYC